MRNTKKNPDGFFNPYGTCDKTLFLQQYQEQQVEIQKKVAFIKGLKQWELYEVLHGECLKEVVRVRDFTWQKDSNTDGPAINLDVLIRHGDSTDPTGYFTVSNAMRCNWVRITKQDLPKYLTSLLTRTALFEEFLHG